MRVLLLQDGPKRVLESVSKITSETIDLILLPEMFTTGYTTEPKGIAEPDGGAKTLSWMQETSARTGAAITGSVAVQETGQYYNRMFFVRPDGSHVHYDKRHLFSFAGEHHHYTAGTERVIVEWQGWRILLQVCYDLRFPVFARQQGDAQNDGADYDMIVYSADWPTARIDAWNILLRARAIENLCYVAATNRIGESHLIDYKGRAIENANVTLNPEQSLVAFADLEALRAFRLKFPALADADSFRML